MGGLLHQSPLKKSSLRFLSVVCGIFICCSAAMQGQSPLQDRKNRDQYTFKVTVSEIASRGTAEGRARAEIATFMAKHRYYKSYKILYWQRNNVPSYYKFIVLFSRERK